MRFDPRALNRFLLLKIPIAWLAGIRVREVSDHRTVLSLRHGWINQNPFGSVYFGVLVMGGELATGIPLYRAVSRSGRRVSMLVKEQQAAFHKKATGRIRFVFEDDGSVARHLDAAVQTGRKQVFDLRSEAYNEAGEKVATFVFRWSIKCLDCS